jgi:transposase-like protein
MTLKISDKQLRGKYTQEFKSEVVRQVSMDQSIEATAKVLGMPKAQPEQLDMPEWQGFSQWRRG